MSDVIAILAADIHLSALPPIARSVESDWFVAMKRQWDELVRLSQKHKAPIIVAGDVFDKWNSNPQVINWAIRTLPRVYAIPGQHDLPSHRYDLIQNSAYQTLVEAKRIINIVPGSPEEVPESRLRLYGFPWGFPVTPCIDRKEGLLHLAVVHEYCWEGKGTSYSGASALGHFSNFAKQLKGYDAVIYGDNHISWLGKTNG